MVAKARFGGGAADGSGTFWRLCFRPEEPELGAEEPALSFTAAFLLRPDVVSELSCNGVAVGCAVAAAAAAAVVEEEAG